MFGSTSKITFAGAGIAFMSASKANIDFTLKQISAEAISWDKMNMLRQVRFFKDIDGIRRQMDKHAAILRPKFDAVLNKLEDELSYREIGNCIKPDGGYFITYIAPNGCAKRVVTLCKEAGVELTPAGATHPYGKDPRTSI
jgi:DNA-binding transcriptional MocR family regulator